MRTLLYNTTTKLITLLLLSFQVSQSQVIYQDQLETVYLNDQIEEVVYTNDFTSYNDQLIDMDVLNFKIEIKKAKENEDRLLFLSERSNLDMLTALYLKILRKGANRSPDSESFRAFLQARIPELMYQFDKDNNIEQLYFLTRKNTFNGKIDALPGVL